MLSSLCIKLTTSVDNLKFKFPKGLVYLVKHACSDEDAFELRMRNRKSSRLIDDRLSIDWATTCALVNVRLLIHVWLIKLKIAKGLNTDVVVIGFVRIKSTVILLLQFVFITPMNNRLLKEKENLRTRRCV